MIYLNAQSMGWGIITPLIFENAALLSVILAIYLVTICIAYIDMTVQLESHKYAIFLLEIFEKLTSKIESGGGFSSFY